MTISQMNHAVLYLLEGGDLQAARRLADINEAILRDQMAEFDQRTDELTQLLADFRANRNQLPMLAVGSDDYHEAFRVLETYRHELELRGVYAEVMSMMLGRLQPIQWRAINFRNI